MEIELPTFFYLSVAFIIFSIFPTHLYYAIKKKSDMVFLVYLCFVVVILLNFMSNIHKSHPHGDTLISGLWYGVILIWTLSFIEIRLRRW